MNRETFHTTHLRETPEGEIETDLIVEFDYSPGRPQTRTDPAEDPEFEIISVKTKDGIDFILSDEEMLALYQNLVENWEDPSWDDETDRLYEEE